MVAYIHFGVATQYKSTLSHTIIGELSRIFGRLNQVKPQMFLYFLVVGFWPLFDLLANDSPFSSVPACSSIVGWQCLILPSIKPSQDLAKATFSGFFHYKKTSISRVFFSLQPLPEWWEHLQGSQKFDHPTAICSQRGKWVILAKVIFGTLTSLVVIKGYKVINLHKLGYHP